MNRLSTPNKNTHTGSTLIEVLIALLVFSIGLQGIASLQYQAVKENFDSSQRSHAVWMAQELINRIKANPEGREEGHYIINIDDDGLCDNEPDPFCATTPDKEAEECDSLQMATFDLWDMFCLSNDTSLNQTLEVTCKDADPITGRCPKDSDFTLTLQWSSKAVKDDTQNITDDADETLATQRFQQVFRP